MTLDRHALSLVDREHAHTTLDQIADHLTYLATHIATARMYADISDLAGLNYALSNGKAYMRASLELNNDLRKLTENASALPPRTPDIEKPSIAAEQRPKTRVDV